MGYVNAIGDRLGRQEEAKQGNLWDWMKGKMIDMGFSYTGGGRVHHEPRMMRGRGLCSGACAQREGSHFAIAKACSPDVLPGVQRVGGISVKGKMDFCWENTT